MARLTDFLARHAAAILLAVGFALAAGPMLTVAGQALAGWTVYGVGYLGTIAALPAVAAVRRQPMSALARVGLAVLMAGILFGVPVMIMVWGFYAEEALIHDLFMPYAMTPMGMLAGALAWLGLAIFGAATLRDGALPAGAAVLMIVAAALALPVELGLLPPAAWAAAFVVVGVALAWVAGYAERHTVAVPA